MLSSNHHRAVIEAVNIQSKVSLKFFEQVRFTKRIQRTVIVAKITNLIFIN